MQSSMEQKNSLNLGIGFSFFLGLLAAIIYIGILIYFSKLDHLNINIATNGFIILAVLPISFIEFSLAAILSFNVFRIFKIFPQVLIFFLSFLFVAMVFFLQLDYYHWSMRNYPLGYDGDLMNRSVF